MNYAKAGILSIAVAVFSGCGGTMPKWVKSSPHSFKDCRDTICAYGIGEASIKSVSLREETAEARGRAKVLEIIKSNIKSVLKDYRGPEGDLSEKAIGTVAEGSLSGVYMADKYVDSEGTVYTLMRLEPTKFKKIIVENSELSQQAREFLRNRTDELLKMGGN